VTFCTEQGMPVPAVTADQMREVDRVAVEEFGLGVLQMMENAGRALAAHVRDMLEEGGGRVVVLAGSGGNGGGGLCCARHLGNHGVPVDVVLDRDPPLPDGPAAAQLRVLSEAGRPAAARAAQTGAVMEAAVVVDALVGYGLSGAPRGRTAELVELTARSRGRIVSLDIPSGFDATSGRTWGSAVRPERTVTLALPKLGLAAVDGDLFVVDIGIPPEVFARVGVTLPPFFGGAAWVRVGLME
jgi:NAD(P)H-hydrate epimerase